MNHMDPEEMREQASEYTDIALNESLLTKDARKRLMRAAHALSITAALIERDGLAGAERVLLWRA